MISAAPGNNRKKIGWIESKRGLHTFHFSTVGGLVDPTTLAVDDDLSEILGPVKSKRWFLDKLSSDADTFAEVLQKIVAELIDLTESETQAGSSSGASGSRSSRGRGDWARSQVLVKHLEELGWTHVVSVNSDLTQAMLRCWDKAGREHHFEVNIPSGYPLQSPTIQATLPQPINVPWPARYRGEAGDLTIVMRAVSKELERLQGFFDVLDDLDVNCWVLDPAQPSYAISSRRIAVERTCSIVIDVRPDDPRAACEVRFLGPVPITQSLQSHLGRNVGLWRTQALVRENLEAVLGVKLPLRSSKEGGENFLLECGICYAYTLQNAEAAAGQAQVRAQGHGQAEGSLIPDQACPNAKCGKVYHNACLVDWLQSVPSSRSSFGTTFGACPYCGEWLSTKSVFN